MSISFNVDDELLVKREILGPEFAEWGDCITLKIRCIYTTADDPAIAPDVWVDAVNVDNGDDYELRASYIEEELVR